MGKEGMGTGSASLVLIFSVLCLTIFALISLSSAENDKKLAEANKVLVSAYYEADTLAEYILAEILDSPEIPETVRGVDIIQSSDFFSFDVTVSFSIPVTDRKELHVKAVLGWDGAEVVSWHMRDIGEWREDDEYLPVWEG